MPPTILRQDRHDPALAPPEYRTADRSSIAIPQRRSEGDEPPPYAEDGDEYEYVQDYEDEQDGMPRLGASDRSTLDEPLNEEERDRAAENLHHISKKYAPGPRYHKEVEREKKRLENWADCRAVQSARDYFVQLGPAAAGRAGRERLNVFARRNVKRRWQKLGVWNREWGIPDRATKAQPNDDPLQWKWRWEQNNTPEWRNGARTTALNPQHPITRAYQLRQGLRRSEHVVPPPRSHLNSDTSASEAESFIITRPWFDFGVQSMEERERHGRLVHLYRMIGKSPGKCVRDRWEAHGAWKDDWEQDRYSDYHLGWKWRHESPSPEPEDLGPLNNLDASNLDALELTPSELDELERIRPPSPSPPPTANPYVPPHKRVWFLKRWDERNDELGLWDPPEIVEPPLASTRSGVADEQPASQRSSSHPGLQQEGTNSVRPRRHSARLAALAENQALPISAAGLQQEGASTIQPCRRSARIAALTARSSRATTTNSAGVSKASTRKRQHRDTTSRGKKSGSTRKRNARGGAREKQSRKSKR